MSKNTRRGGQDTVLTVIGVLLAIGIGWGASSLVDQPDRVSWAIEVVVTLGLCLALGIWLRSRMIARAAANEQTERLHSVARAAAGLDCCVARPSAFTVLDHPGRLSRPRAPS